MAYDEGLAERVRDELMGEVVRPMGQTRLGLAGSGATVPAPRPRHSFTVRDTPQV